MSAQRSGAWGRLARNRPAAVGLAVVGLAAALALLAPVLPLAGPTLTAYGDRLAAPFGDAGWLGTDHLGRDLLARLVWGVRVSLAVGLAATALAAVVGSTIGLVAGYAGRTVDLVVMRGIDMLMAFPYLLLALAIVAALGPGLFNALIAIAIANVPFFARAVRGTVVGLKDRDFITAARLAGLSHTRILVVELLPNVLPVIVISLTTTLGWMILETAGLSYLGLGAQPPTADLGSMLADANKVVTVAPHVALVPGLAILVLVIAINLVGDGVRDLLDPRLGGVSAGRPGPRTAVAATGPRPPPDPPTPSRAEPAPMIAVDGLTTSFALGDRRVPAVRAVSFAVPPGGALGIVGESGSGKSVTALSILGLVASPPGRIEAGTIRFRPATDRSTDGAEPAAEDLLRVPLARLQAVRGNRIAMVFQDPDAALDPLIRVGDQIAAVVRRHRGGGWTAARQRAAALLAEVGLPDPARRARAWPHQLSGGQRQRVAIAMALANDPDLVIADEPTTALDVTTQARVLDRLDRLRRSRGAALILISHDLAVIAGVCDRIAVMYAGEIVEQGPAAAVIAAPHHPYTRRLIACVPVLGRPDRVLDTIPGGPPSPEARPPGCAFAPRCPDAEDACRSASIGPGPAGPDHTVRCRRWRALGDPPAVAGRSPARTAAAASPLSTPASPLLVARDLTCRYGGGSSGLLGARTPVVEAVASVSLEVAAGRTLGVVGESGSGKTTLGRCLVGLRAPNAGTVTIAGVPLFDRRGRPRAAARRRLQMVFQDPAGALNPRRTVRQSLDGPLRARLGLSAPARRARIAELLGSVGLGDQVGDRTPHELSGGQCQRVGIARALAADPALIVLDEPVSALDVSIQAQILALLRDLQTRLGVAYILISHDLAVVESVADQVVVMQRGRIVEQGPPGTLFREPRHPYTRELVAAVPVLRPP